jgi:copper chaperone NosL
MGGDEAVPFSDRVAAQKFVAENSGRIVPFAEVPREYVLGSDGVKAGAAAEGATGRASLD